MRPDSCYLYEEFDEEGREVYSALIRAQTPRGAIEKSKRPDEVEANQYRITRLCWWPNKVVS